VFAVLKYLFTVYKYMHHAGGNGEARYVDVVLLALLNSASDEARATQLNRHRLDADAGTPRVLKALQQTAGLLKVGVKLSRK
jgi:hypothetical protein